MDELNERQVDTYADIADLESRFRPLEEDEKELALTLLSDAAVKIRREFANCNKELVPSGDLAQALKIVSCSMVKRVLSSPSFANTLGADLKEYRTDVGQLSETYGFANPDGALFIRKQEKKLLGLGDQGSIRCVSPWA